MALGMADARLCRDLLFWVLQGLPLDSPQLQMLLTEEKEEEPPFPGARRILEWEQSIVSLAHRLLTTQHGLALPAALRQET